MFRSLKRELETGDGSYPHSGSTQKGGQACCPAICPTLSWGWYWPMMLTSVSGEISSASRSASRADLTEASLNGIHDLGGRDGFGSVEVEEDEPVFHGEKQS